MKDAKWGSIGLGAALSLLLLTLSITLYAYNVPFYMTQHDTNKITAVTGMERSELVRVTEGLVAYVSGEREELNMQAKINGEIQWVYGQREIDHMVDVRNLFAIVDGLRMGLALLFAGGWLYMVWKPNLRANRMKPLIIQGIVSLTIAGLLLGLTLIDFSSAFIKFHEIFFTNDLWILNPQTDVLIQMLPEVFFKTMAQYMAGTWLAVSVLLMGLGWFLDRRVKHQA